MKVYIVHYESLEDGYNIQGFTNKKNAVSKVSNLKKEHRNKLKNRRETDYVGLLKEPKIIIKDFDRIIVHTWDDRLSSLVAELSEHKEIEVIKKYEVLKIPSEYPSTGLIGIYKFIKEFGYVTIFGFDWWDRKQHHYFPTITVDRDYIEKKDHDRGTVHEPLEEYRIIKQLEKQGKLSFLKT